MKLLIIRPSALGDTLMLMPAIAQLRGSTQIVLVGRSPGVDILWPYVNRVIDYEGSGWHRLFLENLDVDQAFSLPEADCAVAFLSDPDGNVNKNLKTCLPKTSVHFFPAFPPEEANLHAAFYLAQCLERAGLPVDPHKCLKEAGERPLLKGGAQQTQKKKIVFHPGSGGKRKNHPPEFWLELIGKLTSHFLSPSFSKTIILLGPAEKHLLPFFTEKLAAERAEILFAPELKQLQSILTQAPLYVGQDSGITHLAAMLGTPTIALFKNTPVHQWRPLGPAVRVIQTQERPSDLIAEIIEKGTSLVMCR
jgi:ADP-heptose:LPS heptosyltransferase